jgi:hypothetical protein
MRRIAFVPVLAVAACGILQNNTITIPYNLDPQEFMHDFSGDFKGQTGNLPVVDCSKDPNVCSSIPNFTPPAGATMSCDATTKQCAVGYDLRLPVPVDLSKQKLPSQVTSSSLIDDVQVKMVNDWTQANTLTFATPPIDLYVGGQTLMKETDPGATKLGTLPSIKPMDRTSCTQTSPCAVPLTGDGQRVLGTLAKNIKTPFTVLLVAHFTVAGGQPIPGGALDLFLQPQIAFVLQL